MRPENENTQPVAAILGVAISAVLYLIAVGVLVYSSSISRGWGGGMGVPGAILQPLFWLAALGVTIIGGVTYAVFAIMAITSKRKEEGCALLGLATFVLVVNLVQLALVAFGPDL